MSSTFVKEFTSFATEIVLRDEAPASLLRPSFRVLRIQVAAVGGGTLVARYQSAVSTLTSLPEGDVDIMAEAIMPGTDVGLLRIWWGGG